MADDILNINGKLIRLNYNGDGTWSWATSLTGSIVSPADYTTTDSRGVAFIFDNLPASCLVIVKNIGSNAAQLDGRSTYGDLEAYEYSPSWQSLLPAGQQYLVPLSHVKKYAIMALSRTAGLSTTLRARAIAVSGSPWKGVVPPLPMTWTVTVAAGATVYELSVDPACGGARRVGITVSTTTAHTFTARAVWGGNSEYATETIPDGAAPTKVKQGLLEIKSAALRIAITNSDTVERSYTVSVLPLP